MPKSETPPDQLVQWLEERAELLLQAAKRVQAGADPREGEPTGMWLLPLLESLSNAETISKRAIHLLTAYALRQGVATATEVARATDVTVTAAMNRGASKTAREVWNEVWPEQSK